MAGSYAQLIPDDDLVLSTRLDGLKLLAAHLSEPVVIFNPALKVVYTNPSADRMAQECPLLEHPPFEELDSCHSILEPCEACPGKKIIEITQTAVHPGKEHSLVGESSRTCPLPRALSMSKESGQIGYVVMMGQMGEDSVVLKETEQLVVSNSTLETIPQGERSFGFIGESPPMQQLVEMIQLVAASETTVLIQGESGTGKELVAKTIHQLSSRRAHPFVVVECSSLPETLLESELFGHVQGAFTGATSNRKGLFEEAEGGTIFLDEIADTTPTFQAKLLRVLQEGEVKPVGSSRSIKVSVRVISACNRSLTDMIQMKAFRPDLYYRLAVFPLTIPPLRERREDIPLLINYFLEQSLRKHARARMVIAPSAMESLVNYPWPGNVRELENLIERAVVTARHTKLLSEDFFESFSQSDQVSDFRTASKTASQEAEKIKILEALRHTNGDKTRTARLLKISRATLYNKLRAYQLQSPPSGLGIRS